MLIGLTGFKGSGKNTVADYLTEKYGFEQLSFAAKVKESSAACFGIDPEKWEAWKNDPMKVVCIADLEDEEPFALLTVREFLQHYGVEAHRDIFGDSFWLDQVLPDDKYPTRGWYDRNSVITDARFDNEARRVKANNGKIVKVERDYTGPEQHSSEQPIETEFIDYTIQNNGTLEELYKSIDEFLISVLLNATS